jgi:hypothetical protein
MTSWPTATLCCSKSSLYGLNPSSTDSKKQSFQCTKYDIKSWSRYSSWARDKIPGENQLKRTPYSNVHFLLPALYFAHGFFFPSLFMAFWEYFGTWGRLRPCLAGQRLRFTHTLSNQYSWIDVSHCLARGWHSPPFDKYVTEIWGLLLISTMACIFPSMKPQSASDNLKPSSSASWSWEYPLFDFSI